MADFSTGKGGPQYGGDNGEVVQRMSRDGGHAAFDLHGRFLEAAVRSDLFSAHNVAAVTLSVALATTYTGLVLSNPNGSGKALSVLAANFVLSVAPAGIASLHLLAGFSATEVAHTTPLAAPGIRPAMLNAASSSGDSVAKVDSAATIPTPWYHMPLVGGFTAGALPAGANGFVDIGGAILVPPGGFVAIGGLTAAIGFGYFLWEELDGGVYRV